MMIPSVRWFVGRSVGCSVCHYFLKRREVLHFYATIVAIIFSRNLDSYSRPIAAGKKYVCMFVCVYVYKFPET